MLQLIKGDCLEEMKQLPDCSVDIVIADLPYGRFKHLEWDRAIDLELLWKQIWRISKPTTPVFLFGDFKFANALLESQPKHFKYEIVWNKQKSTTPLMSQLRFGRSTEYVLVFYKKQPIYNYAKYHQVLKREKAYFNGSVIGGGKIKKQTNYYTPPLPLNVIECPMKRRGKSIKKITEKPQGVLEKLLKYFSNEGDVCLDMCMGSGSCGVACHTLGRKFIGIELNDEHFQIAKERLENIN
jgi:site-specific DNA-methyltransferase (adenine-specific)